LASRGGLNLFSTDSGGTSHVIVANSHMHRFTLRNDRWRGNVTDGSDLFIGNFVSEGFYAKVDLVARQRDDGLLALIEPSTGRSKSRLVRITPSLKLDKTFGEADGEIRSIAPGLTELSTLPDGRFYTTTTGNIGRYLSDGKPDPLFAPLAQRDGEIGTALASGDALVVVVGHGFVRRHKGGPNIHLDSRGTLELAGSSDADRVEVYARDDGRVGVRLNALRASFIATAVKRVSIHGYGSSDNLRISIKKTARLWGGDGNDSLFGGAWHDILAGDAGDDLLDGGAGDDALYGHDGRDTLLGGAGADRLFGNAGTDTINGGPDADTGRQGDGDLTDIESFV
jgi:hypothetical protein